MTNLYKRFGRFHNAGQRQDLDLGRPGPFQRPGTGLGGRPGGQHIIHNQNVSPGHKSGFRSPKGAQNIAAPASGRGHGALARGRSAALQRLDRDRLGGSPGERPRQFRGLIIPAPPQPQTVQRHGHDQVCLGQKRPPCSFQPVGKARHQLQPVSMLESENGAAAGLVISKNGTSAIECRRAGQAGGTAGIFTEIDRERQAAAIAHRPVQKCNSSPAGRAKAMPRAQRLTATDAERRKQQIQQPGFQIQPHRL